MKVEPGLMLAIIILVGLEPGVWPVPDWNPLQFRLKILHDFLESEEMRENIGRRKA